MAVLQVAVGSASGTPTDTATLTGVTAGSTILAFGWDGATHTVLTVADGQGSYTAQDAEVGPNGNTCTARAFTLLNANAGTHAVVVTTGVAGFIVAVELSAPAAGAVAAKGASQTGTAALSSGNVTVSGSSTLVAMSADTSIVNAADEPSLGSGFSNVANGVNGVMGSWRVESKSVTVDTAGTFTGNTPAHNFITVAAAILEPLGPPIAGLMTMGAG